MRYKECEVTIDPKYGDDIVVANRRTANRVREFFGLLIIIDEHLGDDVLACNQRTFDGVPKEPVKSPLGPLPEPVKAPTSHEVFKEAVKVALKNKVLKSKKGGKK